MSTPSNDKRLKIVVVDDHHLFRAGALGYVTKTIDSSSSARATKSPTGRRRAG